MKKVYLFDGTTKKFVKEYECQIDPLESKLRSEMVYLKPANSTEVSPPVDAQNYFWNETTNQWTKIEIPKPIIKTLTKEDYLNQLRDRRFVECFEIINRGKLWYNKLTESQINELDIWYQQWLDVTTRYVEGVDIATIIPVKPSWLK